LEQPLHRVGHALVDVPLPATQIAPGSDEREAAGLKRQRRVRHQQLGIEAVQLAQAIAGAAHALRTIKAEKLRAGRLEAEAAVRASVMRRKLQVAGERAADAGGF